jgi:hypothetical protein
VRASVMLYIASSSTCTDCNARGDAKGKKCSSFVAV